MLSVLKSSGRLVLVTPNIGSLGMSEHAQVIPWALETEVQELQKFDIGVMPLADDEISKNKGGYKLFHYMAVGVPSVASAVGINSKIVKEGITGFLASSPYEWEEKLAVLIEYPNLRREVGMCARQQVERKYSPRATWARLLRILQGAAR